MYETPNISEVGSVQDLTLGQGLAGSADNVWIFSWGS
jgi:hypothetical protein